MLLVASEVPNQPSRKPLLQGYGCRLRGDTLSCEVLFVAAHIPPQALTAELHERGKAPQLVTLLWESLDPALYGRATLNVVSGP